VQRLIQMRSLWDGAAIIPNDHTFRGQI